MLENVVHVMEISSVCSKEGFVENSLILTKPVCRMRNRLIREKLAEIKSLLRLKAEEVRTIVQVHPLHLSHRLSHIHPLAPPTISPTIQSSSIS